MAKHRNPSRRTVQNLTINGGQGGAGGAGEAAGGAGGTGTGPTMNYKIRTKSFVVGRVTNHTAAPSVPSGFRTIPFGDIDLHHEILVKEYTGVVNYRPQRARLRRVYSAQVEGRKSSVAMTLYEGEGAEEEWRQDIAKYMTVRHPNIVQVWRTASLGTMRATIFHDDLIPYKKFLDLYEHSHLATMYIHFYSSSAFREVRDYFRSNFRHMLDENDCTFFMRSSTGRFCADLVPNYPEITFFSSDRNAEETCRRGLEPLAAPDIDAAVINSLTLNQYHQVCYWHNLSLYRSTSSFSSKLVNLGAVYSTSSDSDWVRIASPPDLELDHDTYFSYVDNGERPKEVIENGWTRLTSEDAVDPGSIFSWVHSLEGHELCILWLSQANYIFKCLGISFNFEEYAVVHHTSFRLTLSPTIVDPPQGFLFLCPFEDFRTERPYSFKWPDCPAYWSFDPSGAEPLSAEDAVRFGFPSMQLSTEISGYSRYGEVYAGLREFYQGKGLDPDSQDVARYLGQPLYQLSDEVHGQFTHKSDTILEPLSTHHGSQQLSPTEELSFSNTFRFVRNLVANFVPGTQNVESDGLGFSPIFM